MSTTLHLIVPRRAVRAMKIAAPLVLCSTLMSGSGRSDQGSHSISKESEMGTRYIGTRSTVRDVSMELLFPTDADVGSAEAIVIVTNRSPDPVVWSEINGYRELDWRVCDEKGKPVEMTDAGKQRLWRGARRDVYRSVAREIRPGESHVWRIDIARLYVVRSGKYNLSASLRIGVPTLCVVGVESFEVKIGE